ncbi:MAG: hypothetical protein LAN37_09825 [Acidobacteriia bacterium]|nr:hypothetical protein [Terriglobia bacterium]
MSRKIGELLGGSRRPEWRNRDIAGELERFDARLISNRAIYWRFFYSRDPKRRIEGESRVRNVC